MIALIKLTFRFGEISSEVRLSQSEFFLAVIEFDAVIDASTNLPFEPM